MAKLPIGPIVAILLLGASVAPAAEVAERSTEAPLAPVSLLLDGKYVDGWAIAVGERGHVLVSEDNGKGWRQVEVPSRATLTGVHFLDRQRGCIVGHDATILRTSDGGRTWDRVYHDPEEESPLFDVWFLDDENGFAIGAYGLFLVTSDGGASWTRGAVSEDDDFHLHHIARSGTGRFYIAAEAGTIYRSDDDGRTWVSLPSPYGGSFFGTVPLEGDALLLFGLRGHLFRSEDAGQTWEAVDTGTVALLNRGQRLPDGRVLVVGHEGSLLFSDDQGRSFTLRERADRQALATLVVTDEGGLILIGEFGVTRIDVAPAAVAEP